VLWLLGIFLLLLSVPLTSRMILLRFELSIFLPVLFALSLILGSMFLGVHDGEVDSVLTSLRMGAQAASAMFPISMIFLALMVSLGELNWESVVSVQKFYPWRWNAFESWSGVLGLSALIFYVSGLVLFSVGPFRVQYRLKGAVATERA